MATPASQPTVTAVGSGSSTIGEAADGKPPRLSRSALSWAAFQAGRDPYVVLIGKTVFVPYFATVVVGNAIKGQALVALYTLVASLFVAITAPFLGATIDVMKGRRWWLGSFTLAGAVALAALWFVRPGLDQREIALTAVLLGTIMALISYGDLVHNSMIVGTVEPEGRTRASGLALSLGNSGSTLLLILMLGAFVMPGTIPSPLLPSEPLFGLDPAQYEPNRIVGPVVALAMVIGMVPVMLFGYDEPRSAVRFGDALRAGGRYVIGLVTQASLPRNVVLYLAARMLLTNGKMAILIFGGIYAAGVMGWTPLQLMLLGLIIAPIGILGGALGTWLDNRLGPKRAFLVENIMSVLALLSMISLDTQTIFYAFHVGSAPVVDIPVFGSVPELVYLGTAVVSQLFGTAAFASGRTLMARLTPPDQAGAYFGLFALSGSATMWVLPLLVEIFTRNFASQQAGFVPIVAMMLGGIILLVFVKSAAQESR